MSKSKAQGTRYESALVSIFQAEGMRSRRIAEGGAADRGDVEVEDTYGFVWVVEAKARERLNVTRELAKARRKGGLYTVLAWKRLVQTGKQKRQPDGESDVVIMTLDTFVELLARK